MTSQKYVNILQLIWESPTLLWTFKLLPRVGETRNSLNACLGALLMMLQVCSVIYCVFNYITSVCNTTCCVFDYITSVCNTTCCVFDYITSVCNATCCVFDDVASVCSSTCWNGSDYPNNHICGICGHDNFSRF